MGSTNMLISGKIEITPQMAQAAKKVILAYGGQLSEFDDEALDDDVREILRAALSKAPRASS